LRSGGQQAAQGLRMVSLHMDVDGAAAVAEGREGHALRIAAASSPISSSRR
jgi:hypothetical protein